MQHFLNVYGRTGKPCPRCGRPTRRIVIGQRSTHFCSWCQRLPQGRPKRGDGQDPGRDALMAILRLANVRREVGTFVILDSINAAIAHDERIGLVGANGAGKTTLMKIAAGLDAPDAGEVVRKSGLRVAMLAQEANLDPFVRRGAFAARRRQRRARMS